MRIGEIAALVGVTPRAVRHYHHIGLLAEPARKANGYRSYSVRDAVLLARIRRLTELGLGLDEVRGVLAGDAGRRLADVLRELDADLARQEQEIRERRLRLAKLVDGPVTGAEPVSPALAELLAAMPVTDSPAAAKDREHLTLLDTAGGGGTGEIYAAMRPLVGDPAVLGLYEELDELAAAAVDDPRVEALAGRMAGLVPAEVLAAIPAEGPVMTGFGEALLAAYSPAQAEVVRRLMAALTVRKRNGRQTS
ncbi:MerR family transcriptional regulator [Streptomyces sp. RKAG290]|uniref:MerR family transcriptional regulator n=1 Tax=Streptomyces sp. RKAG290 TaxID=2888348 RepID=UPI00203353C6|nr:MerR family transcriptional regulator [Streptomyces sp. RKAG290]MCM2414448.1 MerR family transcriptional regulator [Streptomyces sp. RKAG290]